METCKYFGRTTSSFHFCWKPPSVPNIPKTIFYVYVVYHRTIASDSYRSSIHTPLTNNKRPIVNIQCYYKNWLAIVVRSCWRETVNHFPPLWMGVCHRGCWFGDTIVGGNCVAPRRQQLSPFVNGGERPNWELQAALCVACVSVLNLYGYSTKLKVRAATHIRQFGAINRASAPAADHHDHRSQQFGSSRRTRYGDLSIVQLYEVAQSSSSSSSWSSIDQRWKLNLMQQQTKTHARLWMLRVRGISCE